MSIIKDSRSRWLAGYGPIEHREDTRERLTALCDKLVSDGRVAHAEQFYAMLAAADRLTCAAMNVVAHMTYAQRIDLDGKPLAAEDFKPTPEGHTGGSLNMVPAFVGYLLANALTGRTRAWLMGQGHCVAAIEAVNALTGDVSPAQQGRYDRSAEGLARLCQDFYSYAINEAGQPAVPLGSHAGPHTAGAISEGGYLGFAELQYIHMPGNGIYAVCIQHQRLGKRQRKAHQFIQTDAAAESAAAQHGIAVFRSGSNLFPAGSIQLTIEVGHWKGHSLVTFDRNHLPYTLGDGQKHQT